MEACVVYVSSVEIFSIHIILYFQSHMMRGDVCSANCISRKIVDSFYIKSFKPSMNERDQSLPLKLLQQMTIFYPLALRYHL